MNSRLSSILIAIAALMVLVETHYFASLAPAYSHVANTISELGQTGSPHARWVAHGFFLPVGLLVWLAVGLVYRQLGPTTVITLSCLGTGYVLSAWFPCDPGAPLLGSWRTLVHNLAALIDYGGTSTGFLLLSRALNKRGYPLESAAFLAVGILVLVCFAALTSLSVITTLPLRGAIQRIAEPAQFLGLLLACSSTVKHPQTPPLTAP